MLRRYAILMPYVLSHPGEWQQHNSAGMLLFAITLYSLLCRNGTSAKKRENLTDNGDGVDNKLHLICIKY